MPGFGIYSVAMNNMISWTISNVCCTVVPPSYCYLSFAFYGQQILWIHSLFSHSSMILESAWVGTGHGDAAGANLGNAVLRFAVFARSTDASSTIPWALMHTLKTFENCFSLSTRFVWRLECPNWLSSQETYHWNPFSTMDWEFLSHMKPIDWNDLDRFLVLGLFPRSRRRSRSRNSRSRRSRSRRRRRRRSGLESLKCNECHGCHENRWQCHKATYRSVFTVSI